MFNKKYLILVIVLLCLILSMSYLFNVISFDNIPLGMAASSYQISGHDNVKSGLENLYKGKEKIMFDFSKNDTCYWIIPGRDENGYYIEIQEFGREYGDCIGVPKNSTYIKVDKKVNMYSQGCVCDGNYVLERKPDGLKITKSSAKIQRTTLLGLTEFLEGLSSIFTKKG